MKLKVRPADFKVTERLKEGVVQDVGAHRIYRVRKEKVTSIEAASELAAMVGVTPADVSMAGLKDRQGVTTQYMTVARGPSVSMQEQHLGIQSIGWTEAPLSSDASDGNDFQIVVRDLVDDEIEHLRGALAAVRTHGLPNYFDDQRFGNLRHGQGWIVLSLLKGDLSGALQRLVASLSDYEPPARRRLKEAMIRSWGDWQACRSISGKLGRHHSVFEHLKRDPDDFEGALHRVGTRERLIHLYAFQSHLWNRALCLAIEDRVGERFTMKGIEGALTFPREAVALPHAWQGELMLPGAELEGVEDAEQRRLYEHVLHAMGLSPADLRLPDVAGFQLKPEPRPAVVVPFGLRVRPAEPDNLHRGQKMVRLEFGLPRGAYATMVLRRLFGRTGSSSSMRPTSGPGGGPGKDESGGPRGGRARNGGPRGSGPRGRGARGGGFSGGGFPREGSAREEGTGEGGPWQVGPRGGARRRGGRGRPGGGGSRRGGGRGGSRRSGGGRRR